MTTRSDRVTRLSESLVNDAARVGAREQRSARQQLEHWVRVGRGVSQRTSASRRRVEAALSGSLAIEALTDEESVVFDAELDADIEEGLSSIDIVAGRTAEGLASVALDDQGRMIEYRPDGTTVVLDA